MENRNQSFNHSSSMLTLGQPQHSPQQLREQEWEQHAYATSQRALLDTMNSPIYQQFRNNTAHTWAPDRQHFSDPTGLPMEGAHPFGSGNVQSPFSDKQGTRHQGSSPNACPSSPGSDVTITPSEANVTLEDRDGDIQIALHPSLADTAVPYATQPHQHVMYSLPLPWNAASSAQEQEMKSHSHSRASSGAGSAATIMTDYSQTMSVEIEDSDGCMSTAYRRRSRILSTGAVADTLGSIQDLHVPGPTNLHHRRMSSRMSSLPTIPSPLGPGRMRNQLGSDTSGLVSPLPGSPGPRGLKLKFEEQKSPLSGPRSARVLSNYAQSAKIFGLQHRQADSNDKSSPSLKPAGFGANFGHARKDTDPFVDDAEKWANAPSLSPRAAQPQKYSTLPFHSSARTPTVPACPTFGPGPSHTAPSTISRTDFPPTPIFLPTTTSSAPRQDLPIPPPPLSSIRGRYTQTPTARAYLDAQKHERSSWILSSAAQITQLSGLRYTAERAYQATNSTDDYEDWQRVEAAYAEATGLEKRHEERRNLFLGGKGMVALRTGEGSKEGDGVGGREGEGGEKGKLLGFKMAFMERICAEVKKEDKEDEEISVEMLATLSLEEKKALRKHLVARLRRA